MEVDLNFICHFRILDQVKELMEMDNVYVETALDEKDSENKVTCLLSTYKSEQALEKEFERLKYLFFFGFQFQVLPLKLVIEHQKDIVSVPSRKKVSEENLLQDLREEREKKVLESQKIEIENLRFELKMLKSEKKFWSNPKCCNNFLGYPKIYFCAWI